jgi:hypothetical protein
MRVIPEQACFHHLAQDCIDWALKKFFRFTASFDKFGLPQCGWRNP